MQYKTFAFVFLIATSFLLSGCLYRLTIQQGNRVSEQESAKLRIGMSKSQVVGLLGKPVLDNVFEENRWYYIYTEQKGNQKMIKKGVVLYFLGDNLTQIVKE